MDVNDARRTAIEILEGSSMKLGVMRTVSPGEPSDIDDVRFLLRNLTADNAGGVVGALAGMFLSLADATSWEAAQAVIDAERALLTD